MTKNSALQSSTKISVKFMMLSW